MTTIDVDPEKQVTCDCACHKLNNNQSTNASRPIHEDITEELDDDTVRSLTFASAEEALIFYGIYARHTGFDVRKSTKYKEPGSHDVVNRLMVCSWQGVHKNIENRKRKMREESRSNCQAHMRVALHGEQYIVTSFFPDHNHKLETAETAHRLKVNRYISGTNKVVLTLFNKAGFRTCKTLDVIKYLEGGKVPFKDKAAYNLLDKERQKLVREGDARTVLKLLQGMKIKDPGMIFEFDLMEDKSISMLFFTDGFCRESYRLFGDVLVFDSTYKTNLYGIPLVIFSGVDNHLKNCVFGAGLIISESVSSYVALLRVFQKAMGGRAPISVLTDEDASMEAAIHEVWPEIIHRLCSWHLEKNCTQNVKVSGFCGDFGRLLKKNLSVEDFAVKWAEITEKHGVAGHAWIEKTYASREHWAEAFFRGHFMGLMRSTSRAESLNAFFKEKGKSGYTLTELLQQFFRSTGKIRSNFLQLQEDSQRFNPRLEKGVLYALHKHASSVYTKEVFHLVQQQIRESVSLVLERNCDRNSRQYYFSFSYYGLSADKRWNVEIDLDKQTFKCDCEMLESDGLPCRHLFCAFKQMRMSEIPPSCIRERWSTETGKQLHGAALSAGSLDFSSEPQRKGFTRIYLEFLNFCHHASESESTTKYFVEQLRQLKEKFEKDVNPDDVDDEKGTTGRSEDMDDIIKDSQIFDEVNDPHKVTRRGAPRGPQQCSRCKETGHNITSCPKPVDYVHPDGQNKRKGQSGNNVKTKKVQDGKRVNKRKVQGDKGDPVIIVEKQNSGTEVSDTT